MTGRKKRALKSIRILKKRIRQSQKSTRKNGTTGHCKNLQKKAARIAKKLKYM